MTKTVKFDLEYSADSTSMSNPTVMLFPSGPNPLLELFITLKDGTVRKLSKNLSATLSANTMLTLNIMIGEILVNEIQVLIPLQTGRKKMNRLTFRL